MDASAAAEAADPADAATTFLTGKLVLEANDYIFGLASANNHLDVTVSILEIT